MSESVGFSDLFAPEPEQPEHSVRIEGNDGWKVLLVDDEPAIHAVLRLALQGVTVDGRPLEMLDARSAEEAKALLKVMPDISIILLDVVMETEHAGLELVRYIREDLGNSNVQIVLVTGQPGYAPQREVVVNYEINGYRLKSELTDDKIFASVHTAIRTFQALHQLELQRIETEMLTASLRENEGHLRSIVESAPDAIIVADENGTIIDWNPGAENMFGYTASEVVGKSLDRLLPQRHRKPHNAALARIRTGTLPRLLNKIIEVEALHKSGKEFPIEIVLGSWTHTGCRNFSAIIRDITERKSAEREIQKINTELERRVIERTADLALAKQVADTANMAKSAFLANMSHEIRTPMSGVIGMTDVLLNTSLTAEQMKMARIIRDSANTQLAILNDILDFSKIEAGKLTLSPEPFSLPVLVDKICAEFDSTARGKDVIVSSHIDQAIPAVLHGDALRVRQILSNLLSNAIKFSSIPGRHGKVELSAKLTGGEDERIWVELTVRDNGIGMDTETLKRIFHPFVQADDSTTKCYGGTGLGLVISLGLVETMGGKIQVESTPNHGSTFCVCLPFLGKDETSLVMSVDDAAFTSPIVSQGTAAAKILVAEDNETNQEVIRQQLSQLGYQADIASDGREAFSLWLQGNYGMLISDLHMPHMNGFQLAQAIRDEERKARTVSTPIVALTANALKGEADHCRDAGMNDYLTKPASLSRLKAILEKWLASKTETTTPADWMQRSNTGDSLVFDPQILTNMIGDDFTVHRRLLETFLTNAEERMAALQFAADCDNAAIAGQLTHALKSASRSVGAIQLGDLCEQIEKTCRAGDPAFKSLLPSVQESYRRVRQSIFAFLGTRE